jgi:hypothetical protein
LEKTLQKSQIYCNEFDQTSHMIEGIQMIQNVFKNQLHQSGALSELDVEFLKKEIETNKQTS